MCHLSKIASAGFSVQLFEAEILVASLDDSGDLPHSRGMEYFDTLLIEKYMDLDPILEADLEKMGIENPVLIEVDESGWFMADGHHRLAWAVVAKAPVPVVLVDMEVDIFELDRIMSEREEFYDHKI